MPSSTDNDVPETVSSTVSPPRMDRSYEDEVPLAFSSLAPSFYKSYDDQDELESIPSIQNRSPDCNVSLPSPLGEYFETDPEINELESISNESFNEDLPAEEEYDDVSSQSSWEASALVCQSELEKGECPQTPPETRKRKLNRKIARVEQKSH